MLLVVRDLFKSFDGPTGPIKVLDGISLQMTAGETLALTGESGSGKSTLLHLVGGLDQPDQGSITLKGQELTQMSDAERSEMRRMHVGVIFQQFNLIPSLTVSANIAFQARLANRYDPQFVAALSAKMGLQEQMDKYPEQLSGGQQQRVAIARTLAAKPGLILADEPTGNLDETTADDVLGLMLELLKESGASLLMVTHSERVAAQMERRLHLRRGQIA